MTVLARLVLFASSYAPAAALLGVRVLDSHPDRAFGLFAVAFALTVAVAFIPKLLARPQPHPVTLVDSDDEATRLTDYVVAYLLPFIFVDVRDTYAVIAAFILLTFVGVLYIRLRLVYLNPLMALLGYRVWRVKYTVPRLDERVPGDGLPEDRAAARHAGFLVAKTSRLALGPTRVVEFDEGVLYAIAS